MINYKRLSSIYFLVLISMSVALLNIFNLQFTNQDELREKILKQNYETYYIPAPRGDIFDRDGNLLATSEVNSYLFMNLKKINDTNIKSYKEFIRFNFTELQNSEIENLFKKSSVLIKIGPIEEKESKFLKDIQNFQAFEIYQLPKRVYKYNELFSHVIGYIGSPNLQEEEEFLNSKYNLSVGKNGIERYYDNILSGTPGIITFQNGDIVDFTPPKKGKSINTSLDINLQTVVRESLIEGILLANKNFESISTIQRGASIVQDISTGEIISIISIPDFNPNQFIEGISEYDYLTLTRSKAFNNYSIQGLYPPGSVFKIVAYWLALNENLYPEGAFLASDKIDCQGNLSFGFNDGSKQVYKDWKLDGHGLVDLGSSIKQSCNVYFWDIALKIWRTFGESESESILQEYAKNLGFGTQTNIDLPFEKFGIVPDRQLFEEWKVSRPELVRPEGWLGGDLMNLIIGQGAITVTPIQVSNAYRSLIYGQVDKPYLVEEYFQSNPKDIDINTESIKLLLNDFGKVTNVGGTAYKAFSILGSQAEDTGGKTGTAQNPGDQNNTSWFVGIDSISTPKYIIVTVVEEGGSGSAVAAPITRRIIQYLKDIEMTPVEFGEITE